MNEILIPNSNEKSKHSFSPLLSLLLPVCGGCAFGLTCLGAPATNFHPGCVPCIVTPIARSWTSCLSRLSLNLRNHAPQGCSAIGYAEVVFAERVPNMTICQSCEIEAIHSKLAYQTNAYFCRRIDWRGRNSAETGSTWG